MWVRWKIPWIWSWLIMFSPFLRSNIRELLHPQHWTATVRIPSVWPPKVKRLVVMLHKIHATGRTQMFLLGLNVKWTTTSAGMAVPFLPPICAVHTTSSMLWEEQGFTSSPKCLLDACVCLCVCVNTWDNACPHHAYTRRFYQPAPLLSSRTHPAVITKVNKYILMIQWW